MKNVLKWQDPHGSDGCDWDSSQVYMEHIPILTTCSLQPVSKYSRGSKTPKLILWGYVCPDSQNQMKILQKKL